jgi:hypothetical protein
VVQHDLLSWRFNGIAGGTQTGATKLWCFHGISPAFMVIFAEVGYDVVDYHVGGTLYL